MNIDRWIAQGLALFSLIILQGCGPSGGGSNEAPRVLDVQTLVHTYSDHEAESDMTMKAFFHVDDENGIDDIDFARVTFPDGTNYTLQAHNRLFERNGEYYMRGFFYMPSTGSAGEKSFAMHGYKVEVVDKLGASNTQIFSVTEEGGNVPSSNTRIVHPDDYTLGMSNAYSALKEPIIHDVTVFSDGVQIDADITDSRAGELQFYFSDSEGEWFTNILIKDTTRLTIPGRCTYTITPADVTIEEGYSFSDTAEVYVSTYDPGTQEVGPFTGWSYLASSTSTVSINQDAGTVPNDNCGDGI